MTFGELPLGAEFEIEQYSGIRRRYRKVEEKRVRGGKVILYNARSVPENNATRFGNAATVYPV